MQLTKHAEERINERALVRDIEGLKTKFFDPLVFIIVNTNDDGSHFRQVEHEGYNFYAVFVKNLMISFYGDNCRIDEKVLKVSTLYREFLRSIKK